MDQDSQNNVLINNSRTAWPLKFQCYFFEFLGQFALIFGRGAVPP